jgi:hypothetical protein
MIPMLFADFLNTLTLWQWGLLALVPPAIIALYFLKLRREPLAVPSTYLWSRAIEDLHVNSLWQRLRQSLLLFLQLLLIGLLAFTLLRPGWQGTKLEGDRFVFLIDTSASMRATDIGPSRLDNAKRQAIALIEQMQPGSAAMIISFSNVARVEQPFTDNRRLLRTKIELIEQTNRPSDLSEALRAASGLANPGQSSNPEFNPLDVRTAEAMPATLYVLSDGGFRSVPDFKLGNLEPIYLKTAGDEQQNLAITAFSTDVNPEKPGSVQAFGRLESYSPSEITVEASLFLNDTLLDAKKVTVPAQDEKGLPGATGVQFEMKELESGILKLVLDAKDNLDVDNTAWAVVNLPRPTNVLVVTPGNDALELALATDEAQKIANISLAEPKLLDTKAYQDQAAEGTYDLIVYDQCVPKELPACNTLFIGRLPPTGWKAKGPKQGPPLVIDTDQVHPLTQLVQMGNVKIVEGTPLEGPPGTVTLIDADIGTIYAVGPRAGYEDAVLGFDIVSVSADGERAANTDWPIRRSFPVFVMNAVKYLGGVRSSLAAPNIQPGQPSVLRTATPVANVLVNSPRGDRFEVPRETQNTYIFSRTEELGVYDVREGSGKQVAQQFAVNLFDSRESNLTPAEKLDIGHEEVKAQAGKQEVRQELWKWLLLGAIGVLIFEWYIYNRRVYL